jgi:phosphoglycerate kinase
LVDYDTINDVDVDGKRILVRIDINSPLDENGEILDDTRFKSHIKTLEALSKSRVVLMAHQGRPGRTNFSSLRAHSKLLSTTLGQKVHFSADLFGDSAIRKIKSLKNGEILLLENTRFYSEEIMIKNPIAQAQSLMVKRLKEYFDLFVNDAFAASHRKHVSMTGFPEVIKSVAGHLMIREIGTLDTILQKSDPTCVIIGGKKLDDSIQLIRIMLEKGLAKKILITGEIGIFFLYAIGCDIGPNCRLFDDYNCIKYFNMARSLLHQFGNSIEIPEDIAYEDSQKRKEITIASIEGGCDGLDHLIKDIGSKTINKYCKEIGKYNKAFINGVAGNYLDDNFSNGTRELLNAVSNAKFSVACAGGGRIPGAINRFGLSGNFDKESGIISTGGASSLIYLAKEKLPGIESLRKNKIYFP